MNFQENILMFLYTAFMIIMFFIIFFDGFETIKRVFGSFGAILWGIITWPRRQRKLCRRQRFERKWKEYIEHHKRELIDDLVKTVYQEINGGRYASEQDPDAVKEKNKDSFEDIQNDKEDKTWKDQIMDRFMKKM